MIEESSQEAQVVLTACGVLVGYLVGCVEELVKK